LPCARLDSGTGNPEAAATGPLPFLYTVTARPKQKPLRGAVVILRI
jgi:hypothetical protein